MTDLVMKINDFMLKARKLADFLGFGLRNYRNTPWSKHRPIITVCRRLQKLTLEKISFFQSRKPPVIGQLTNLKKLHDLSPELYLEHVKIREIIVQGSESTVIGDPCMYAECDLGIDCPTNIKVRNKSNSSLKCIILKTS